MQLSSYLEKALEILDKVKAKAHPLDDKIQLSIQLAHCIIEEANLCISDEEVALQKFFLHLYENPEYKNYVLDLLDQSFRSCYEDRTADQMRYLLQKYGLFNYFSFFDRIKLRLFQKLPKIFSQFLVGYFQSKIRSIIENFVKIADPEELCDYLNDMAEKFFEVHLCRFPDVATNDEKAKKRLKQIIKDLKSPQIEAVSFKISSIFVIDSFGFESAEEIVIKRLSEIFKTAQKNKFHKASGEGSAKKIFIDMGSYDEFRLTCSVFKKIVDKNEFSDVEVALTLQAYLPESFEELKEIIQISKLRVRNGSRPLKIRLVKGGNLALEKVNASKKGYFQAPFASQDETNANFKKMLNFALERENATSCRVCVATHNIFDLSYAMILAMENNSSSYVSFEMYEGLSQAISSVVHKIYGKVSILSPVIFEEDYSLCIPYLFEIAEEISKENSIYRYFWDEKLGTVSWKNIADSFSRSFNLIPQLPTLPRRSQKENSLHLKTSIEAPFQNEPTTDLSLEENSSYVKHILDTREDKIILEIPISVGGVEILEGDVCRGLSPAKNNAHIYSYVAANKIHVENAISAALTAKNNYKSKTVLQRSELLLNLAKILREKRSECIGSLMWDVAMSFEDADEEVSRAVDLVELYARSAVEMEKLKELFFTPKGVVVVISSWDRALSCPIGNIIASLVTGNSVIFKPSSFAVLVGWKICQMIWASGFEKDQLQFLPSKCEHLEEEFIRDHRVNLVCYSGEISNVYKFLKIRPDLDLVAQVFGKNAMIISSLCDNQLAIESLVQSSFSFAGQYQSSVSLAIIDSDLYDDPNFMNQLKNAVEDLHVTSPFSLDCKFSPLIEVPKGSTKRALTRLDFGEKWLVAPNQDQKSQNCWSPGLRIDVKPYGFCHMNDYPAPVLSVIRADDLKHAIEIANLITHPCSSTLYSLDEREKMYWMKNIKATNLFFNSDPSSFVVRHQLTGSAAVNVSDKAPKAAGSNYLKAFVNVVQKSLPVRKGPISEKVGSLNGLLDDLEISSEKLALWSASISNYAFAFERMKRPFDYVKILGQDNVSWMAPIENLVLRIDSSTDPFDAIRVCAAVLTCGSTMEISLDDGVQDLYPFLITSIVVIRESKKLFIQRIERGLFSRIRILGAVDFEIQKAAAENLTSVISDPVLATGRLELLHYLKEISFSHDYHRYGILGSRESENRRSKL